MASSVNVNYLSFQNIKHDISDSIVLKHSETKLNETGEFIQDKHCYSYPLKGKESVCLFTALSAYLSMNKEWLSYTEKVSINPSA